MGLQTLLGDLPLSQFVADYYHRLPYSAAGLARPLCELGTWDLLTAIVVHERADVLVCRQNEQYSGPVPRSAEEARRLTDEGYTLLVRHAERHDPRLARLAAEFAADFAAPVNIHMYCTPPGQFGFGWHYDAEEVFIVQTAGRKEYSLRKNTVNPWPIEATLPADMCYEREIMPLARCELAAGDWLYIPSGYWHRGTSRELALSLAIGVQPRTGIDVFDFLRRRVLDSLPWRQRLPVAGRASGRNEQELEAAYREQFAILASDLGKQLADPTLAAQFIAEIRAEIERKA
jgi:ribosomal protein L16 Arg81 hydroxylase